MPQFHETGYGRRFFEGQLPQLINALKDISTSLKEQDNEVVIHVRGGQAETVMAPHGVKVKIIDWDEVRASVFTINPVISQQADGSILVLIGNEEGTISECLTLKEPKATQYKSLSDENRIKFIREMFPEQVLLVGSYID